MNGQRSTKVNFFGLSLRLDRMARTLILKNELYNQLARGAAVRGVTVETLLERMAQAVDSRQSAQDRTRSRHIERLLAKYQDGPLNDAERAKLDRLIDEDYQVAVERADRHIEAKPSKTSNVRSKSNGQRTVRSSVSSSRGRRT